MPTKLLAAALAACLAACATSRPARPVVLHAQYVPSFRAVQEALAREDLGLAERTLAHWRGRLAADAAVAARATAESPLPPGRPNAAAVADAERMIESLGLVLEARRTMAAIDLGLELRRVEGAQRVEVWLTAESALTEEVELAPGPANLEVVRLSVHPSTGLEVRVTELLALTGEVRLEVPPGGTAAARVGEIAIGVPSGAIATRTWCDLVLRSGTIDVRQRALPVRALAVRGTERTDLPGWLPPTPVEPAELARLVALPDAALSALLERAVRILPERRVEALEALREPALARTLDEFELLVPVLRWLAVDAATEGRDPARWRVYVLEARWRSSLEPAERPSEGPHQEPSREPSAGPREAPGDAPGEAPGGA